MLFIQISTPSPIMDSKLIGHGKFRMQNNQLLTKILLELKHSSNTEGTGGIFNPL